MIKSNNYFDKWLLVENRRMAYQGMLEEYKGYQVYEADLEQAQGSLNPSIRLPADED